MSTSDAEFLRPQLDLAEEILTSSPRMHPIMGRAVIEFARLGAQLPSDVAGERLVVGEQHDALLTTTQAAAQLRVSEKQIYRLVSAGRLRSYMFGRRHRFRSTDLNALVQQRSTGARLVSVARLVEDERRAM